MYVSLIQRVMENLLECDGRQFSCRIVGIPVAGKITVEDGGVFLCQNVCSGIPCRNKHGYRYSWFVNFGTPDHLAKNRVEAFQLQPISE